MRSNMSEVRKAHHWTANKLDFLELYMPRFISATQRAMTRHYVDGFAGPGLNDIDGRGTRNGSPLIALNVPKPFTDYHFVEKRKSNFESLVQHVSAHPRSHLANVQRGDFNECVTIILSKLHPLAPTLFFLDPEGLELEFATLQAISARTKSDVFVLISSSGVMRNLRNKAAHERITRFYGSEEWRDIHEKFERREYPSVVTQFEVFTDHYVDNLRSLGYQVIREYLVSKNNRNVPMHALVFAVKSNKPQAALDIARSILVKLNRGVQDPLPFEM